MRSSHIKLSNYFTLKTYSLEPITWSTFVMQQSSITLVNTSQLRWRDVDLQTIQNSTLWILLERLEMVG